MKLITEVGNLLENSKEIGNEEDYVNWVRKWKLLHHSVVSMIHHHKGVNQIHSDEWAERRERIAEGKNTHKTFVFAFNDERIDEGARRNNQRWKNIFGNVAREMYMHREVGKTWIKDYLSKNPSSFRRAEVG